MKSSTYPTPIDQPPSWTTSYFYKKIFISPFMIFQKTQPPLNNAHFGHWKSTYISLIRVPKVFNNVEVYDPRQINIIKHAHSNK